MPCVKETPSRLSRLGRGTLGCGMLCCVGLMFLLLLGGCAPVQEMGLTPKGGSCQLISALRDNAAYELPSPFDDPSSKATADTQRSPYRDLFADGREERGCLVLWARQSAERGYYLSAIKQVALTSQGALKNLSPSDGETENTIQWDFPKKDLAKEKVEFRLYVLRNGATLSLQQHITACGQILKPGFQCFPADLKAENPCWFYLRIQPDSSNKEQFKFAEVQKGCQVCSREICGNNIDEDCDGKADNGCGKDECHHPGSTRPCKGDGTAEVGVCKRGQQTCEKVEEKGAIRFQWGACKGAVLPTDEVCNGKDDDCDGSIDEGAPNCCVMGQVKPCQQNATAGKGICRAGIQRCYYSTENNGGTYSQCLNAVEPKPAETCNGKDDDCDGAIDNGISRTDCTVPNTQGPCARGKTLCKGGRSLCETTHAVGPEICDGIDNDCNGSVDEVVQNAGTSCPLPGKPGCKQGVITGCKNGSPICSPTQRPLGKELCGDGIDNDCNGKVDAEDPACECKEGTTRACYTGPANSKGRGSCVAGTQRCLPGGGWGKCVGERVPSVEVCDGKDNDCDGQTDESFPTKGETCLLELQKGPCRYGVLTECKQAKAFCKPNVVAAARETCDNNLDDNCNGLIDDGCGCKPGESRACYLGPPGSANNGPCKRGQQKCIGGRFWDGCKPSQLPVVETCNGVDDDCDGKTDENNPGGGASCKISAAKGACSVGTLTCSNGQLECKTTYKASKDDPCDGVDNDCDGLVDEDDKRVGKTCTVPKGQGPCAEGKVTCKGGALQCESQAKPTQETCNGIDDDCDGRIDNNLTRLCANQKGVCAGATAICAGEKGWLPCSSSNNTNQAGAQYEFKEKSCDGKDNDCDGEVDEAPNSPGKKLTRSCYDGEPSTQGKGTCKDGNQSCVAGKWGPCEQQVKPISEICGNQKDDNCDGLVDEVSLCGCWGDGRDGTLVVESRFVLDKDLPKGRKQPALIQFPVTGIDGTKVLVSSIEGLAVGDRLLLVSLQGDAKNVGKYLWLRVNQLSKGEVTVNQKITTLFGVKDNRDLKGVKVRLVRVPQFKEVQVKPGASLQVTAWDGTEGGILLMHVMEGVQVSPGGSITVAGKGFRGGTALVGQGGTSRPGESYLGWATSGTATTGGGGSGTTTQVAQSGGGGGHATKGGDGLSTSGDKATAGGVVLPLDQPATRMLFGSGGGAGGNDGRDSGKSAENLTGAGGAGGGILWITARMLNNSGLISAAGGPGGDAKSAGGALGGGGGGAGGTLVVQASRLAFYAKGLLNAEGGDGGNSSQSMPGKPAATAGKSKGGAGGEGRIEVRYSRLQGTERSGDTKELSTWTRPTQPLSVPLPKACLPTGG